MMKHLYFDILSFLIFGMLCFYLGVEYNKDNFDINDLTIKEEGYQLFVDRCKNVVAADQIADIVIDVLAPELEKKKH